MPDQPFPSELISDYLDNQLSAGLRAEFESRLANDANLKMLVDGLQRQSAACGALPKFQLSDTFAERLLNSKEVQAAMAQLPASTLSIPAKPAGISSRHPLRFAAIAIASLAALVLITLFLQIPDADVVPVASKGSDVADKDSTVDALKSKTAASAAEDASVREFGSDEINDSKSAATDWDASRESSQFLNKELEADQHSQNAPPDSVAKSRSPDSFKNPQPIDPIEKAVAPEGKELAQGFEADFKADRSRVNSIAPEAADGQNALAMELQESNFDDPEHIAGRRVPDLVLQQPWNRGGNADATGQPGMAGDLNDVIEIRFDGGTEMLTEFHSALTRNSIAIEAAPPLGSGPIAPADKTQPADSREIGETRIGRGGGGGEGDALGDKLARDSASDEQELGVLPRVEQQFRDHSNQIEAGSQAYLLTATPGQMVGLITDLQNQADVSAFRLSNTTPETAPQDAMQSEADVDPLDEDRGGHPVESASGIQGTGTDRSEPAHAAQWREPEPGQPTEPDRSSQPASRGQAMQLSPQMELRNLRYPGGNRGVDGKSQPPMADLIRQKQVLPQSSGDSSENLKQLNLYFGALDSDLPAQKYLLLVHTNDTPSDANLLPESAPGPVEPAAADDK